MERVHATIEQSGDALDMLGDAKLTAGASITLSLDIRYPGERRPVRYRFLPIKNGDAREAWRNLDQLWNQGVISGATYDDLDKAIKLAERVSSGR